MSSSMTPSYPAARGLMALFGGGQALVVGGGHAGAGDVLAALLAQRRLAAGRLREQGELVEILVYDRLKREIGVLVALGIVLDLLADAPTLPGETGVDPELLPALGRELEMEEAPRLDLHAVAPVAAVLHAHD